MSTRHDERTVAEGAPHPIQDLRRLGGQRGPGSRAGRIGQHDGVDVAERIEGAAFDERVEPFDGPGLEDVSALPLAFPTSGSSRRTRRKTSPAARRRASVAPSSPDSDDGTWSAAWAWRRGF